MKCIFSAILFTFININFVVMPPVHLFAVMAIAITLDFITGVARAIVMKQARTSNGYRKTVTKFIQYGGGLSVSLMIRYLVGKQPELEPAIKYANWMGNGLLIFIIFIEFTSVLENIYTIDKTSSFSRYFIRPCLKIFTFQIKNNPVYNRDKELTDDEAE